SAVPPQLPVGREAAGRHPGRSQRLARAAAGRELRPGQADPALAGAAGSGGGTPRVAQCRAGDAHSLGAAEPGPRRRVRGGTPLRRRGLRPVDVQHPDGRIADARPAQSLSRGEPLYTAAAPPRAVLAGCEPRGAVAHAVRAQVGTRAGRGAGHGPAWRLRTSGLVRHAIGADRMAGEEARVMTTADARIGAFEGFGERALDFYEGLAADNSRSYWQDNQ